MSASQGRRLRAHPVAYHLLSVSMEGLSTATVEITAGSSQAGAATAVATVMGRARVVSIQGEEVEAHIQAAQEGVMAAWDRTHHIRTLIKAGATTTIETAALRMIAARRSMMRLGGDQLLRGVAWAPIITTTVAMDQHHTMAMIIIMVAMGIIALRIREAGTSATKAAVIRGLLKDLEIVALLLAQVVFRVHLMRADQTNSSLAA
mmetsp:Transcript_29238/g.38937  ORF Transcript_29238/g.38937 Transcript_29238/m.38937 type:complete len:205 (+) Transcript_29238:3033-3647(+)